MSKPVVAFLDVHAPEVRAVIAAAAPARIELRMADSTDPGALEALAREADFFVGGIGPLPAALVDAAPRLRLIHKWGIGVDKIDLAAARRRRIPVAITAGANAVPVAEFTLLLILATLRRLPHWQEQARAGAWQQARATARVQARQLRGRQVGLVGFGAIGREVARRLRAFEAEVCYYDPRRPSPEVERSLGASFRDLDDLLSEVDIVSLHVPLLGSTRGLLSRARIARLKPGAIVINTARGELIDEAALLDALERGHLAAAGLDVFCDEPAGTDHPLLAARLPGLVTTPHLAGSAYDNVANVAHHVFANVERVLDGEPLPARDVIDLVDAVD
jgi:phosphoglycerate dehydrogenase-like enzyme